MSIYEKLLNIQSELKAPKSQRNDFGKYNYRNCEDILEAVKPLCKKYNAVVYLSDELVIIGERYYIEATATLVDVETSETIEVTAYAREEESKKGMDGSQVTGASSSYARKYALNGLFDIDDTKDSDTTNQSNAHLKEEQPTDWENHIKIYAEVLASNSDKTADVWIAEAKKKYQTPKAQAEVLLKWCKQYKQQEEQKQKEQKEQNG